MDLFGTKALKRIEDKLDTLCDWTTVQALNLNKVTTQLNKVLGQELSIQNKEGKIMALVQVEQDDLDALDTALDEAATAIEDKVQALVDAGNVPPADLSALQEDVANLRAIAAPTPAPDTGT